MYIVILDDHPGYFGPFKTEGEGLDYIKEASGPGRVVALIKPWSLSRR
jgi:hypothetical protein